LLSVFPTPLLRLTYGLANGALGGTVDGEIATVLALLIWQAPLYFVELYATTWLLVIMRARSALGLALLHIFLLTLLLPLGATRFGAIGAAWATLAAQVLAAVASLWWTHRLVRALRLAKDGTPGATRPAHNA
jgi:Na+-driven multidrug efflux pump